MGDHDVTHDEIKQLLHEQSTALVRAMVETNQPIERRLDAVNAHLRELNGKVASHAVLHAATGVRLDVFTEAIDELKDERRSGIARREEDRETAGKGEDRRLTMRDVYIVLSTAGVLWVVFKALGLLK